MKIKHDISTDAVAAGAAPGESEGWQGHGVHLCAKLK